LRGNKLKALVKFASGIEGMTVKEVPEPKPDRNELKVRVLGAGICGTDIHIMRDEYPYNPPVILGHEYMGIVEEAGCGAGEFKKGDFVISLTAAVTCGKCRYCREGLLMLCDKRLSIGSGMNGAFAEYVIIPADLAFKIPDEVENKEDLAICEPFACIVRGVVERSAVKAGDIVLISGPGTIGLMTLQLAKLQGAYVVISGTPDDEHRLELAKKLGADVTVSDPSQLDKVVRDLSPYGVDVAFECAGVKASADACVTSLRKQGIYSQIGLFGKQIPVDMDRFLFKEIQMTNSFASERTSWETALRLLKNRKVTLSPLISARLPLEEWKEGFGMVIDRQGYKVVLVP